jgi:predicted DNA-binding transcriptional regulator YafY
VKELAEELEVADKTVRRDLESFQRVGFPLHETVGPRGLKTWHLDAATSQPDLSFAYDEAIALYLGRRLMEPLAGTPFWDASQRAFRKIRASLDHGALDYIHRFAAVFHQTMVGTSDYSRKAELIDRLMVGCWASGGTRRWPEPEGLRSTVPTEIVAMQDRHSSCRNAGVTE